MISATDITYSRAEKLLKITFDDGAAVCLPAEFLRVESPSAEVQGHHPSEKQLLAGKRDVAITGIEPTGNYAIRLIFSDGHETGIYSWAYLHLLGRDQDMLWDAYLRRLAAAGLSRG